MSPQFFAALFAEDLKRASQPETNKKKMVGDCQNFQNMPNWQKSQYLSNFFKFCKNRRWLCRPSSRSQRTCWWKLLGNAIHFSSAASSPMNSKDHWSAFFIEVIQNTIPCFSFFSSINHHDACSDVHPRAELSPAALLRDAGDDQDPTCWLPNQVEHEHKHKHKYKNK